MGEAASALFAADELKGTNLYQFANSDYTTAVRVIQQHKNGAPSHLNATISEPPALPHTWQAAHIASHTTHHTGYAGLLPVDRARALASVMARSRSGRLCVSACSSCARCCAVPRRRHCA